MKKLMTKENGIMLGVAVLAFVGVRYLLKKQNEEKSNASGRPSKVPCTNPTSLAGIGSAKDPCCTGDANCGGVMNNNFNNPVAGYTSGGFAIRPSKMTNSSRFSGADGGCGCGG